MFTLISPASKALVLTLSAGLVWSALSAMAQGFPAGATPTAHIVQLAPVLVVGHRDATLAEAVPDAKLTKAAPTSKNTAI